MGKARSIFERMGKRVSVVTDDGTLDGSDDDLTGDGTGDGTS